MDRAATVATWVNIVLFGGLAVMCQLPHLLLLDITASGFREGLRQLGEYWAGLASLPEAPAT